MNLFSTSNPNIFGDGRGQEDNRINEKPEKEGANGVFSRDTNDRNGIFERSANLDFGRKPEEKEGFDAEENINDALNIFDDDLDEPKDFLGTAPMQTENIRDRSESRDRLFPMQDPGRNMGLNSISFKEEREEPKKEIIPPKPIAPPPPPKPRIRRPYRPAPIDYFDCRDVEVDDDMMEVETAKDTILDVLHNYGITEATIASVTFGPTITRYNVVVPRNVSPKKLVSSEMEIAMAMNLHASKGVNIYPNFEDGAISLEVPKKNRQTVQLGCMLTGDQYVNAKPTSLVFSMGKDVGNKKVYGDICKMVHLLVAGSTGSGKSVFLSTLIISLINRYSPDQLRLILIDPKKTEFVIYHDLPHLMVNEIITDPRKAIQSLNWAIGEMNRRYELFAEMGRKGTYVVNVDEYNAQLKDGEEKLPKIVIVVDELADLMLAAKKEVEDRIQNLTQKSRAAGIHLIIATQRPSADVITGVIKANLATRIAFMVATDVDSRVILDASGAQKLLGYGDMMYTMSGVVTPIRVQSAFISSTDSQKVIDYIRMNNEAYFDEAASNYINNARAVSDDGGMGDMGSESGVEEVYIEALKFVILSGSASISMIQRKCSVGYNKAGKIVEWMEDMGYISAFDGAKARKVLISKEEFESKYGPLN
jgi:S-DNA-T family DNA segregation ATPase FtsK/SpoIIIE